jgi:diguanylate cyclase (GGDEF)-like protein
MGRAREAVGSKLQKVRSTNGQEAKRFTAARGAWGIAKVLRISSIWAYGRPLRLPSLGWGCVMAEWVRVLKKIALITGGSMVVSVGLSELLAFLSGFQAGWHHYFFSLVMPAIMTPLWAIPLVRSNTRLDDKATELDRLARTDPLSGIANRRAFFERATAIFAAADNACEPVSVMMIDIDLFKSINDTHGHDIGDAVIQSVAARIECAAAAIATPNKVVGRIGGEEFAVVIAGSDHERAMRLAQNICDRIGGTSCVSGRNVAVTVSIGVAMRGTGDDIDAVLRAADRATYKAKAEGRNRCCLAYDEAAPASSQSGTAIAPLRAA